MTCEEEGLGPCLAAREVCIRSLYPALITARLLFSSYTAIQFPTEAILLNLRLYFFFQLGVLVSVSITEVLQDS